MPVVHVSMFPDKPIDVPDSEVAVLRAQGVLVEEQAASPRAATLQPSPGGKDNNPKETE